MRSQGLIEVQEDVREDDLVQVMALKIHLVRRTLKEIITWCEKEAEKGEMAPNPRPSKPS